MEKEEELRRVKEQAEQMSLEMKENMEIRVEMERRCEEIFLESNEMKRQLDEAVNLLIKENQELNLFCQQI